MDSISEGLIVVKGEELTPSTPSAESPPLKGTPSTTYNGSFEPKIELLPRILTTPPAPG